MNRILLLSVIFVTGCAGTKPLVSIQPKIADTVKAADTIKAADEIAAVKSEIHEVKGDISAIKEVQLDISAKLETNLEAIAGVNNKIEKTQAGRDVVNTQTNDTSLMKYMIYAFLTIILALVAFLRAYFVQGRQKKYYKERVLLNVKDEKELEEVRSKHDKFVKTGRY